MTIPAGNGYTVEVRQIGGLGTTWIVRVQKRVLVFKKRISSDWFLDGPQATRYAEQLAAELRSGHSIDHVERRPPGWNLHRPSR